MRISSREMLRVSTKHQEIMAVNKQGQWEDKR